MAGRAAQHELATESSRFIARTKAAYVKRRLKEWGGCCRALAHIGTPRVYYGSQPFSNSRINMTFEAVEVDISRSERWARAAEVDSLLEPYKRSNPLAFEAVVIQYVDTKGKDGASLTMEGRLALWKEKTGLGKTRYYFYLKKVYAYLIMELT